MSLGEWTAYPPVTAPAAHRRGGILPDFLIAPHARLQASRFLTRDTRFFGDHFDGLNTVHPANLTA